MQLWSHCISLSLPISDSLCVTNTLLYIMNVSSTIIVTEDVLVFMSVCHHKGNKNISVSFLICFLFSSCVDCRTDKSLHGVSLQGVSLTVTHTHTQFTPWGKNECLYVIQQPPQSILALTRGTRHPPNITVTPPAEVKLPLLLWSSLNSPLCYFWLKVHFSSSYPRTHHAPCCDKMEFIIRA